METWGNKVKKALSRLGKVNNYLYNKPEQEWTQQDKALAISFLRKAKVAENMKDLKQVQEFFSKPLEEITNDYSPLSYAKLVANGKMKIEDAMKETGFSYVLLKSLVDKVKGVAQNIREEEDPTDLIAMDVPLFIRMLEWAREDAETDMELHDAAERAIEAVKLRGLLSMEDYRDIVGASKDELDEVRLVPKDQLEALATKLAAQVFSKKQNLKPAVDILKKALEDSYKALDPDVEIKEETGYSKYLVTPENPKGKTPGLTQDIMDKILMKIANVDDIDETIRLGENMVYEELCPKGKAYIKKRQAAGEKSSAYLSGRAVKVCKGQMKG